MLRSGLNWTERWGNAFEMAVLLVPLLYILSIITICHCYYLSLNLFTADQGEYFCINHCQSNIASIPDNYHFLQAMEIINDSLTIFHMSKNVWIGLRRNSSTSTFKWVDNTAFNFGSIWTPESNIPTDCVNINTSNLQYRWESASCSAQKHVLCNHCDGILNKYIARDTISDSIDDAITCFLLAIKGHLKLWRVSDSMFILKRGKYTQFGLNMAIIIQIIFYG